MNLNFKVVLTIKTRELIKLVKSRLATTAGSTFYSKATNGARMPYKVFSLSSLNFDDPVDVYDLCVDVWHRSADRTEIEEIADQVEALFRSANLPQDKILPTFYLESRHCVDDPDKELQHIQLHFSVRQLLREV